MRLGFIGLGKMGQPMTLNLLNAGYAVTVHNRSRAVVDALHCQGAQPASSPVEVANAADLVYTCLPTPAAVEEVYFGANGLLEGTRAGLILVDCSTVGPELSRRIYAAAQERGADFLDAPISGGTEGAKAGTLTVMVGGDAEVFARARPVLEVVGATIHHVGSSGAGAVVKLVNQLLVAVNTAALVEAIVLGVKAGADPEILYEVLQSSYGSSRMLTRSMPLILERKFEPMGPINLVLKDLGLIHEAGKSLDVRLLLGAVAEEIFKEGRALGLGDEDMAALVKPAERLAGIEVRRSGE